MKALLLSINMTPSNVGIGNRPRCWKYGWSFVLMGTYYTYRFELWQRQSGRLCSSCVPLLTAFEQLVEAMWNTPKPLHSSNSSASDHLCIKCTGLGADGLRVAWSIQWVICQNGIRVGGSKLFGSVTQISSLSFYFVKRTYMIRIWDVQILVEIATQPWKALVARQAPRAPWKESGGKRCGSPLLVFLQLMDIKTHQTSSTTNKCDQINANPYQRKSFVYEQIGIVLGLARWICVFLAFTAGLGTMDCVEAVMLASPACESSEISTAFSTWGSVWTSVKGAKGASDMIISSVYT